VQQAVLVPWPGQGGGELQALGALQGDASVISLALCGMTPAVHLHIPRVVFLGDTILTTPQLSSDVIQKASYGIYTNNRIYRCVSATVK